MLNWQINKTKATLYLEKTGAGWKRSEYAPGQRYWKGWWRKGLTEYAQSQGMEIDHFEQPRSTGLSKWGISSTAKIIT